MIREARAAKAVVLQRAARVAEEVKEARVAPKAVKEVTTAMMMMTTTTMTGTAASTQQYAAVARRKGPRGAITMKDAGPNALNTAIQIIKHQTPRAVKVETQKDPRTTTRIRHRTRSLPRLCTTIPFTTQANATRQSHSPMRRIARAIVTAAKTVLHRQGRVARAAPRVAREIPRVAKELLVEFLDLHLIFHAIVNVIVIQRAAKESRATEARAPRAAAVPKDQGVTVEVRDQKVRWTTAKDQKALGVTVEARDQKVRWITAKDQKDSGVTVEVKDQKAPGVTVEARDQKDQAFQRAVKARTRRAQKVQKRTTIRRMTKRSLKRSVASMKRFATKEATNDATLELIHANTSVSSTVTSPSVRTTLSIDY